MAIDATPSRHNTEGDKPDSKHLDSITVKEDPDTEKGFTTASSQDNGDEVPQGHWSKVITTSWSKRSTILQIFVWLVFTG